MTIPIQQQRPYRKKDKHKYDYRLEEEANQDYKESHYDSERVRGTNNK